MKLRKYSSPFSRTDLSRLNKSEKRPAVVFGLFETGLGVARSLGQKGITVIGIDFKKDIACYSRYVQPLICPNPDTDADDFISWIKNTFAGVNAKLPAFISSDTFLIAYSKHRLMLDKYFVINIPDELLIEKICDKYEQHKLALFAGVNSPQTMLITNIDDISALYKEQFRYPLIVKGMEVISWRSHVSGSVKGFQANDQKSLISICERIVGLGVSCIVQEVISGTDTNHYKYCCYVSHEGHIKSEFALQKIRQNPIHFGVGASVVSVHNDLVMKEGRKLFKSIEYTGVGSAEFKFDDIDGKFKLIEINPRYWQQNYLTTASGLNMAYTNYCDLLSLRCKSNEEYKAGIKWVNIYMDLDSFIRYRREGIGSFKSWIKSLKGKKTWSDFTWDDPVPVLFEIRFGLKLLKLPKLIVKYMRGK